MSRNNSRINGLLVGLLAAGLSVSAFAQSAQFPTYSVGENLTGSQGPSYTSPTPSPWVVSSGQIITPVGTQVYLPITSSTGSRVKAVAVNPTGNHTAAALQLSAPYAVTIFNTQTGAIVQNLSTSNYTTGAGLGLAYTSDGKYLLFSQYNSYVAIANVAADGTLTAYARINVPASTETESITISNGTTSNYTVLTNAYNQCNGKSVPGTSGGSGNSSVYPCGKAYSSTVSYPLGVAVAPVVAGQDITAYAVLDTDNTLQKIDLTSKTAVGKVVVGNVPNSVVLSPDGTTAYVSNEGGPSINATNNSNFQEYSDGTPVLANYPQGSVVNGTISVVNVANGALTVKGSITVGHHPTAMAFWQDGTGVGAKTYLLVSNTYDDTISVIDATPGDPTYNTVVRTINLGLPISVPFSAGAQYGAAPNSLAVDNTNNVAYVALYLANAVAKVNLIANSSNPVEGLIPVGYAPSAIALDTTDDVLIIGNDKGIGTTGFAGHNITTTSHGSPAAQNTHEDLGTVSIVSLNGLSGELATYTKQVYYNNHWDLSSNINSSALGSKSATPIAIPLHIGDPSLIKHVFVIIRENRTYDQMLGDIPDGNWGDPALAVFGDGSLAMNANNGGQVTPNAHALVSRFPLFDNFYDPSRQSADGHNWIVQAMAPYSDDIQSPLWERDYPSNGGDALAYQNKGHLWDVAAASGVSLKNFGEYIEYDLFNTPTGSTTEPNWESWYQDTQCYEAANVGKIGGLSAPIADNGANCLSPGTAGESQLYYYNTVSSYSPLPNLMNNTVQNYPQFDLTIVDQYRFDIWNEVFQSDLAKNAVPQLEFMWISSDHTGSEGALLAQAQEADNDLAVGRFVDAISHSSIWNSSAIFIEEDDAQDGVDHIDGHRSPGYVVSPFIKQSVDANGNSLGNAATGAGILADHTFYTQVNFTRTIEQILGLTPMNQFDLVASPMYEIFLNNVTSASQLPAGNLKPWNHVANQIPLFSGLTAKVNLKDPKARALQTAWLKAKVQIFKGKEHIPDSEDPNIVAHIDWYEGTNFAIPFPGEKKVLFPSQIKNHPPAHGDLDD